MRKYVMDGTNVCRSYENRDGDARLDTLLVLLIALLENGDSFIVFFDANTLYVPGMDKDAYNQLLTYRKYFNQVPGGIRADDYLLHYADEKKLPIISNDKFRDFYTQYPWLKHKKPYIGKVSKGSVEVHKLNISKKIQKKNYLAQLTKLLGSAPTSKRKSSIWLYIAILSIFLFVGYYIYNKYQANQESSNPTINNQLDEGTASVLDYEANIEYFEDYKNLAQQGNSEAYRKLAILYYHGSTDSDGRKLKQSYEKAFQLFEKSANLGNNSAVSNVGFMYLAGEGIDKDEEKGIRLIKDSARNGNTISQKWLNEHDMSY